jgi:hypothetical protein
VYAEAAMSVIELLLVVLLLLLVFRGGLRSGQPLWIPGKPIVRDDPIRLILFVILILLLSGFLVRMLLPLGDSEDPLEQHRSRVPPPFALHM